MVGQPGDRDRGSILEMAMNTGGEARGRAERLIDHLRRRGFSDLGALPELKTGPESDGA